MTDTIERLSNLGLERTVLGQVLAFGLLAEFLAAGLEAEDFYRQAHRQVWAAIQAVEARGQTADLPLVGSELRAGGVLEDVGAAYYSKLGDGVPKPRWENIVALVTKLRELATARELIRRTSVLTTALEADPSLIQSDMLADQLAEMDTLRQRPIGSASAMLTAQGQVRALHAEMTQDRSLRMFLGLPTLDNILDGVHPGEVCGLMARPGIGKTLLLGHITRALAEREAGVVFFSLEMPAAQIVTRLARALTHTDRYQLQGAVTTGTFDEQSYLCAFHTLILIDKPGLSVGQMDSYLRQAAMGPLRGIPIRAVVIDHLGLVGGDRGMSTYDRVSTQARETKELAKRHKLAALLAIQVNREQGGDGSKELTLASARDSGVVEEAMDYLVAVRRLDRAQALSVTERERYRDALFLSVLKNRHGALGDEFAVRMDTHDLGLTEDPGLTAAQDDLARLARVGARR